MNGRGTALTIDELRSVSLFADLERDNLESLARGATVERYMRKDTILPEGSKHDGIIVVRGGARLYRLARPGIEVTIALLGAGDTYLLPVAAPSVVCVCLMEASRDETIIYRIPAGPLRALIARNLALSDRVLTIAAQTVTMLADRLEDHIVDDVRTRLAHALADMDGNPDVPIMATHQELAALIGTTQNQVTKALADLRHAGLVASEHHRRGIVVLQPDTLAHYGSSSR
jgi:CRP-like cAMP-binding protein